MTLLIDNFQLLYNLSNPKPKSLLILAPICLPLCYVKAQYRIQYDIQQQLPLLRCC